jgi:ComF family protein
VTTSRSASQTLLQVWNTALDLLFPPRCVSCKRRGAWLCARCRAKLVPIPDPLCVHCGQSITSGDLCPACQERPLALHGLRSAHLLEGPLRSAIHAFKYNGLRPLAGPLGEMLFAGHTRFAMAADIIVPVPLHRARQSQRGFNQSLLLAQELAGRVHLPVDGRHLVRLRDTRPQVGLGATARRTNVQGAFTWTGESLAGQRVLLVDDVCTTGATLESCADALYDGGAAEVWGLTLAREKQ